MSKLNKIRLDGIEYALGGITEIPIATTEILGGIKPDGTTITVNTTTGVASVIGGSSGQLQSNWDEDDTTSVQYIQNKPDLAEMYVSDNVLVVDGDATSYNVPIATTSVAGKVKPDGTTITVTNDGTITATTQTVEADDVTYDNTASGMTSVNVQDAIDELSQGSSSLHNYSLTEQVVGKWIDDKPVYEKTIIQNNNSDIDLTSLNIKDIIDMPVVLTKDENGTIFVNPCTFDSFFSYYHVSTKTIKTVVQSATTTQLILIIRYTKTTD